jgi:ubiquinone/menaquinone biosynthesis C-methylase UbiE
VGVDANEKMLSHARNRTGNRAQFHHANLEEPLDFLRDNSFDGVLSSLTITYVHDHASLFSEFRRILRDNGWFVFSTEHPFFSYRYFKLDDYFCTREVGCDWRGFGKIVRMQSYFHSLGSISEALSRNHFVIETILEPKPTDEFKAADPEGFHKLMKFPLFICIRARKLGAEA